MSAAQLGRLLRQAEGQKTSAPLYPGLVPLVAGGATCGLKGGRHIRFAKATPLANLHLTLLDKVGVRLDKFADSSGKLDGLFSL